MAPPTSVPPSLPPSVEEAYRRKCVQLKNRTNEVEDANDAARLRLARIKRQVEKLRIERAFLLEQLSKRTSTNVEDSEGSPSPPPTPKDKPLRIKRGHRKSAITDADSKATPSGSLKDVGSPSQSQTKRDSIGAEATSANGVSRPSKLPKTAFELYCEEARPALEAKNKDGDGDEDLNIDEELARAWEDLPDAEREEIQAKFEELTAKKDDEDEDDEDDEEKDKDEKEDKDAAEDVPEREGKPGEKHETQDEDVEMTNYDTEDQDQDQDQDQDGETQMDKETDE